MSTTPPHVLTPDERTFLQRIINLYHRRLLSAWNSVTGGTEAVPASHTAPPSIADWPNDQIHTALDNYSEHLQWFELDEGATLPHSTLAFSEEFLIENGILVLLDWPIDWFQQWLDTDLTRWEEGEYPALKPRWDQFKREKARRERKLAGGEEETEGEDEPEGQYRIAGDDEPEDLSE